MEQSPQNLTICYEKQIGSDQLPWHNLFHSQCDVKRMKGIQMDYILGIDMGVASIGWAAVFRDEARIDCGVRVFPAGVDNFNSAKEKHPNQDRRAARCMRRRIRRKAQRKQAIRNALQETELMPTDPHELDAWWHMDVYKLRHRAIQEKLLLTEIGRIFYHLNQRRGFLSLRKKDEAPSRTPKEKGMLEQISELQRDIDESGYKTLGNYLFHLYESHAEKVRLRNRHTRRSMIYDEFCAIWNEQNKYYPDLLNNTLRYGEIGPNPKPMAVVKPLPRSPKTLLEQFGLENIIFFQRAVYREPASIGFCELEPDEYRSPIADRLFQRFRMLQEVNNLRVVDPSQEQVKERPLTTEERNLIVKYLERKKESDFDSIRKYLAKKLKNDDAHRLQFNLEQGGRTKISAMTTDYLLASTKAYGKDWWTLQDDLRNQIVGILYKPAVTDDDIEAALNELDIDQTIIQRLVHTHLPTGYSHLSIKALSKLLPYMEQGFIYHTQDKERSALHAAGYIRRDEVLNKARNILPAYDDEGLRLPIINSPIVIRALTELRKVVNGVIRKHGKPSRIHIEMARELKMGLNKRKEVNRENHARAEERAEARKALEKLNIIPNREAENLYLLWKAQEEKCAYSCKIIGIHQLFSGEIEIDHIYPFSRSADDSFMNKVVCLRSENRDKMNRTPYEWLAQSDPEKYDRIIQQAKHWPYPKRTRLLAEKIPEGFIQRDLNDTAWMARAAQQYLACLFDKPHHVQGTKGAHTALLRDHWQLHGLLRNDAVNLKNRDDHRHHALDAAVIALCDQNTIANLAKVHHFGLDLQPVGNNWYRVSYHDVDRNRLPEPWNGFREVLKESLNNIWVSHRPRRKISGKLHDETYYGKTPDGQLVVRKSVSNLKDKMVKNIRDSFIRTLIENHLAKGGSLQETILMPSGIPIKKVRILVKNPSIAIRDGSTHVQSAATHHLAIYKLPDGTHHFEGNTLMEVMRRLRNKEPIVRKVLPTLAEGASFLMHLCPGDSIMTTLNGHDDLFIFNTMALTSKQIWFTHHADATPGHKDRETKSSLLISCMPSSFDKKFPMARKVSILPSGEIRTAQ